MGAITRFLKYFIKIERGLLSNSCVSMIFERFFFRSSASLRIEVADFFGRQKKNVKKSKKNRFFHEYRPLLDFYPPQNTLLTTIDAAFCALQDGKARFSITRAP